MLYGVLVAANLGGLMTPYGATSSAILYELTEERTRYVRGFLLGVAYSANLGGTGFFTGSGPNLVLKGKIEELDSQNNGTSANLTFATWMFYAVPPMLVNVVIAWFYLTILFFGKNGNHSIKMLGDRKRTIHWILTEKYRELGRMNFHEVGVFTLFLFVLLLWLLRSPRFIPGWAELISGVKIGDATAAMLVVVLLFVIPRDLKVFSPSAKVKYLGGTLLDWNFAQKHLPWGVVLLMGGGFAISDAATASGLSQWIGENLNAMENLPLWSILVIVCVITASITEVASNTAVSNVIIPILLSLSERLNIHPLYLALPVTISCSFAFMLPVATPPNAIVFGSVDMKMKDMMKVGWLLNITCIAVLCAFHVSYGNVVFDFDGYIYKNSTII